MPPNSMIIPLQEKSRWPFLDQGGFSCWTSFHYLVTRSNYQRSPNFQSMFVPPNTNIESPIIVAPALERGAGNDPSGSFSMLLCSTSQVSLFRSSANTDDENLPTSPPKNPPKTISFSPQSAPQWPSRSGGLNLVSSLVQRRATRSREQVVEQESKLLTLPPKTTICFLQRIEQWLCRRPGLSPSASTGQKEGALGVRSMAQRSPRVPVLMQYPPKTNSLFSNITLLWQLRLGMFLPCILISTHFVSYSIKIQPSMHQEEILELQEAVAKARLGKFDPRHGQLARRLNENIKFLRDAWERSGPEKYWECLSKMGTVNAEPGQVLIRQGDESQQFFILLRGRVSVHKMTEDGRKLLEIDAINCFGELGLLEARGRRKATVIAFQKCCLYTLAKKDFQTFVRKSMEEELAGQLQFFSRHFGIESKGLYFGKFVVNHLLFRKGEFVFRQGQVPQGYYVIKAGEVKVRQKVQHFQFDLLFLQRGSFLHQLDLFQQEPVYHQYSAQCLDQTNLFFISVGCSEFSKRSTFQKLGGELRALLTCGAVNRQIKERLNQKLAVGRFYDHEKQVLMRPKMRKVAKISSKPWAEEAGAEYVCVEDRLYEQLVNRPVQQAKLIQRRKETIRNRFGSLGCNLNLPLETKSLKKTSFRRQHSVLMGRPLTLSKKSSLKSEEDKAGVRPVRLRKSKHNLFRHF